LRKGKHYLGQLVLILDQEAVRIEFSLATERTAHEIQGLSREDAAKTSKTTPDSKVTNYKICHHEW
jgi:hypothetical protein